jgi:TonB-linked SusC/RagA family outer membrane protein
MKSTIVFSFLFLCLLNSVFAQTRTITGKLTSEKDNAGIPGVTVTIKGSKKSAFTDAAGSFRIEAPSGPVTLELSSIGYEKKEIAVGAGESSVNVNMAESSEQMGEVVVTALGISREARTLVYATQTVKPATLTEVRDPNNILNSLQGKVANAVITQGSGGPGSGARIVMRGNRSIQGNNNALIVIDGVPITNTTNSTATSDFGSVQASDGATDVNPDDIESISILRGASAAALYGSQAGNGVLVITTKKGVPGKLAVTLNSGVAVETPFSLPKFQNTYGQGNGGVFRDTMLSGESWGAAMTGQSIVNYLGKSDTYSPQPDNVKDFFRTGTTFNNSIGISAGGEKAQTYFSYTNNAIEGIIPRNNLLRHTINFRMTNQISSKFSTDVKVTYIAQDLKNRPRTGEENAPVIDIYQIPRNVSLANAQQFETINAGIPAPGPWPSTQSSIYQNPYWMINRTAFNTQRDRVIGFITAKYQLTPWLNIQGRANLDRIFDRNQVSFSQSTLLWAPQVGGFYGTADIISSQRWFDAIISGANSIGKDFKISYNVGAIYQDTKFNQTNAVADGLNVANKFSLNFASAPSTEGIEIRVQNQGFFGQANLAFKEFLYLDASLRNDFNSTLPSPHSFSYPSVGLSAILSDVINLPAAFSFLKVSANYARVGNSAVPYITNATFDYSQGAGNGFISRGLTLPIADLNPEIVKNIEFNVDAKFLANRLGLTLTYYKSNAFNQLLTIGLPPATGYSNQYLNAGNVQNQGVEIVVNGTPVQTKKFTWDVTFNFGSNKNKIVRLSDDLKSTQLAGGYGRSATPIVEEGGSYGDLVGLGWQRDAKGQFVVTAAGLPVPTTDRIYLGNFNSRATLGLSNSFTYGRFALRLLIDGRIGGTMVSGTELNLAFSGIPEVTAKYRDAGSLNLGGVDASGNPVSASTSAQNFWQIASGKRYGIGEFFAYDLTNFRVREFSLGYDIFKERSATAFIKKARLSFVARNLFFLYRGSSKLDIPQIGTRKMWFDPDMSLGNGNFQGIEYGTLPSTRSIGANLQITF